MSPLISAAMNNVWVRYILILLLGITVGAVFYPTKRIDEKISQKYEQQISTMKEQHNTELKEVQESLIKSEQQTAQVQTDSEQKIFTLTTQISELKSKKKQTTYKIIKPDGTVIERTTSEEDVDNTSSTVIQAQQEYQIKIDSLTTQLKQESDQKITKIQSDFTVKEAAYQQTISSLQSSKTVSVNQKQFGLEGGMLTNRDYYGHITMDVWGPMFIGIQGEFGTDSKAGAGIGIRF